MGITYSPMALNTIYMLINSILIILDLASPLSSVLMYYIAYMTLSFK